MTLADKVTALRLILAPVFFVVYVLPYQKLPGLFPGAVTDFKWVVPVLWGLFIISEITDLVDGKIARSRKEVSDFGKLFDPFADVLVRITYFLCFVLDGILPAVLFLVVLYREIGIQFLRNLMMKKGIVMGARKGGKIKAVAYMLAGAVALLAASAERLGFDAGVWVLHTSARVIFCISVVISVGSFVDYLSLYKKQ
ncbi:MAG: CDP-diacylglycerol--glycerol-3-phosphate 3-phosphatidyltransferase [Treponema sp.]|jgi:CDP-diacylglycerol--glycerol-3-phosphate 3-phosphatidyltransferase|nr:CDP-diacylglycerol--glycerol-3-phosphate 3-phosphatidyltransferase [Treponema sp.]